MNTYRLWNHRAAAPGLAALVALFAGGHPADAATYNPSHLRSDQLAQVRQLCETTLRLRPGESHFDGCVAGLSDSLASAARADAISSARAACIKAWMDTGAPDFAECLLDASEGRSASSAGAPSKSFFSAPRDEVLRGEKLSCARLGLDPVSGAFAGCVANLAGALSEADGPGG